MILGLCRLCAPREGRYRGSQQKLSPAATQGCDLDTASCHVTNRAQRAADDANAWNVHVQYDTNASSES